MRYGHQHPIHRCGLLLAIVQQNKTNSTLLLITIITITSALTNSNHSPFKLERPERRRAFEGTVIALLSGISCVLCIGRSNKGPSCNSNDVSFGVCTRLTCGSCPLMRKSTRVTIVTTKPGLVDSRLVGDCRIWSAPIWPIQANLPCMSERLVKCTRRYESLRWLGAIVPGVGIE